MARNWFVNGPTMVYVKGNSSTLMPSLTELGLSQSAVSVHPTFRHKDINVDAWGHEPAEIQSFLSEVHVSMDLIHVDRLVLAACLTEAQAGGGGSLAAIGQEGTLNIAGALMGNNVARFAAGNHYIGLNLSSPVGGIPWRFYYAYLADTPVEIPLGTEKSVFRCRWRVVPYVQDPYNGGLGSTGYVLWDHTLDV